MNLTGTITVPLPPHQAIALFTPEGERGWVPDWEPHHHSDRVFTTHHATTWIALDAAPEAVRYARFRPDHHAGTVEVACRAQGTGTAATVTYDLTPLADHALDEFAAGYDAMLADWERRIAEACSR